MFPVNVGKISQINTKISFKDLESRLIDTAKQLNLELSHFSNNIDDFSSSLLHAAVGIPGERSKINAEVVMKLREKGLESYSKLLVFTQDKIRYINLIGYFPKEKLTKYLDLIGLDYTKDNW